jgi:hypothetical protein
MCRLAPAGIAKRREVPEHWLPVPSTTYGRGTTPSTAASLPYLRLSGCWAVSSVFPERKQAEFRQPMRRREEKPFFERRTESYVYPCRAPVQPACPHFSWRRDARTRTEQPKLICVGAFCRIEFREVSCRGSRRHQDLIEQMTTPGSEVLLRSRTGVPLRPCLDAFCRYLCETSAIR